MNGVGGEIVSKALISLDITELNLTRISFGVNQVPEYKPQFCRNLVSLKLFFCENLNDGAMEFASKLPNLRQLCILFDQGSTKELNFVQMGFRQLRNLVLLNLYELKKLIFEAGSLPNLVTLGLVGCSKMLEIEPEDGLKYLPKLAELSITKSMSEFKGKCELYHSLYPHLHIQEL